MSIERKYLIARLAEGSVIVSRRVVPFPHRFYLDDAEVEELEEIAVGRLTESRIIAPRAEDALWDRIVYRVTSQSRIHKEASEYWPHGFGHCAVCETILGAGVRGTGRDGTSPASAPECAAPVATAPRHGANKALGIPPCDGSGQPLVRVHLLSTFLARGADHAA